MLSAACTQPLAAPWRPTANAARLHISFDRIASLVVDDHQRPAPQQDARVFDVDLIARLILTTADGSTLEQRVIRTSERSRALFTRRVTDTAEWATAQHPDLAITTTHDAAPIWHELVGALHDLCVDLDDRIRRTPVPPEVNLDRRRRVA